MRRWGLRAQVAALLTAGLLLVQGINLGLALEQRRAGGRDTTAEVAASRLADQVARVGEVRSPRAGRRAERMERLTGRGPRDEALEAEVGERLASVFDVRVTDLRAVEREGGRGGRSRVVLSAKTATGEHVAVTVRGPTPIGPLIAALVAQTLMIGLALLLPLLWLLGRATRPLARLTAAARDWRPGGDTRPLPPAGPADVRALTAAFEVLRGRVDRLLSEKDVMLGAIGHDLRTPLAALRLEVEGVDEAGVREPMIASLERLADELESILALARSGRALPNREPIDLAALLEEVVADWTSAELRVEGQAIVAGDAPALRRAVANLVDNVERYGGRAHVTLSVDEEQDARIQVTDDGPGLPEDALLRAGEPFVRFETSRNRATGGHGLGLAIARATAERHGGSLTLANGPQRGLEVTLTLPLAEPR